jgi:hypothetical protein
MFRCQELRTHIQLALGDFLDNQILGPRVRFAKVHENRGAAQKLFPNSYR